MDSSQLTRRRVQEICLVTALLAVHWALAVTSSIEKSPTFDETSYVTGGYYYWTAGDYRFLPESGIFPQRWAALPLLAQDLTVPGPEFASWRQGNVWLTSRVVFFQLGNDAETMLLAARSMIALVSVALGALVYLWSRSLFGRPGAFVSLGLFTFSPTILAHASMVTADLCATFFFLLAVTLLARVLARVTWGRIAAAGLGAGGLVTAKMSWLLFLPMAALLVAGRLLWRRPWPVRLGARRFAAGSLGRRLAVAAAVGLVMILLVLAWVWTAYGWRFAAAGEAGGTFLHSWEEILGRAGAAAPALRLARDRRLAPEAFLWGLTWTLTTQERDAFLCGRYSSTGWLGFFPYAFLVKTPLPFLALLVAAAAGWLAGTRRGGCSLAGALRRGLRRTAPLWVLIGVYGVATLASTLNTSHRHLLPIYPALFILAGGAALWLREARRRQRWRSRAAGGAVVVLLGLFVVDSWRIRPHYLSYFNALAGGPENAYHNLVDSSLDWGQDLPALARYLERLRRAEPSTPVYVAYLGIALPSYYGIEARWLHSYFPLPVPRPPLPLEGGIYCVSATLLQTLYSGRAGPWTPAYEAEYRALRDEMNRFWERYGDPAARPELLSERSSAAWEELFRAFNQLRSVRLFHFLRRRPPDARAGYSILVFRLSRDEVRHALDGPPPVSP